MTYVRLVPVGHYQNPTNIKWNWSGQWVTYYFDVRLYLGEKILRAERFRQFEAAQAYCRWVESYLHGN